MKDSCPLDYLKSKLGFNMAFFLPQYTNFKEKSGKIEKKTVFFQNINSVWQTLSSK